jgi:hypothetical protein
MTGPDIVAGIRRLSMLAVLSGLALLAIALLWWGWFYRPVGLGSAFSCLYGGGGACDFIRHVAAEAGRVAYSPKVFRLGAVALAGGSVVRLAVAMLR